MQFKRVAQAFEVIDSTSSRLVMTERLAQLLKEASAQEASHICYFSLGVLNPPHIGTQFNLAQKNILKLIARLYNGDEQEVQELLAKLGDLGLVVEQLAPEKDSDLSVDQVYDALEVVEKLEGNGSQEQKSVALQALLSQLDHISGKYVVRIMLGTLRLGFSDMTLVDALSWMETGDKSLRTDIENAYNVCADIGLVAKTMKEGGIEAIRSMNMMVGVPVRPAAAERLPDVHAIMKKLGPCVAQPKLDGFRLQVHVNKTGDEPEIHFFSRNLTDMSAMFPEFIEACKRLPVETFIADGEAMVYDPNTHQFASFQETVKRRRKHGIEAIASELPLQLHLFDVLFVDGENVLNKSQTQRRNILEQVLKGHADGALRLIEERKINTAHELEEYFLEELSAGLEGVVVKKLDAVYQPGKRSANWIKLKYQTSEKLLDSLDVVILGYYAGRGKRAKFGMGAFLVGIYNAQEEMYETVAKIGTGLSDEQWVELKQRCDALAVPHQPKNVRCDKSLFPAVWVAPEQVCEVLADQVTLSPVHTAGKTDKQLGFALRFPRFLNYRDEKSPQQATTVAELATLHKG